MVERRSIDEAGMRIRGVDFFMYRVSDLSRAVEFYRDVLGLPLQMHNEAYHWAEFGCGGLTLSLHAGEGFSASSMGARVALAVDDIEKAYAEVRARGVRISQPLQDYGVCRAFEILDPDGNAILIHRRTDGTFGN